MTSKVALYSAVGEELTHYRVDVEKTALERNATIRVPANVQYAWPHPSRRFLYVATSNRGAGLQADHNHLSAYRIDPLSGALTDHGEPQPLPRRAVHICVTPDGRYVLSAHNLPKTGITVNAINADGTLGAAIEQPHSLDFGIYPHQVMMSPSNRTVILVDRGNGAHDGKAEDPGALRTYRFADGVLSEPRVVAPNRGYGFGPRHLDFHPSKPWVFVNLETQSMLHVFRMPDDVLEVQAAFVRDLLADRPNAKPRQLGGTVHVHPNGRFVYLANRADSRIDYQGRKVFNGGENSIAVFSIDQATGEPTLVQHADTHSYHVRTFAFDPSARMMVAASIQPIDVLEADEVRTVPAALTLFRVGDDGRLDFVRRYDVGPSDKTHYWMGIVGLAVS
jgi:6-phosphogluconolactonase (cycloisomerase 2 family)